MRTSSRITRLVSIDSSSNKTGWAMFENGEYINSGIIDCSKIKGNSEDRAKTMCRELMSFLNDKKPDIIVIEKLGISRNMVTVRMLCRIIDSVFCYSVINDKVDYVELLPSQWRAGLGLQAKGRNRDDFKKLAMNYIKEHYGIDVPEDQAESICIGISYINKF